ncbi:uncharacterized protein LOC18434988 isoform X1 [Amborella trichopoda]|uniref:uncharacterized protein LOC18434988 isoform X1 n=1 Tax=Amborella trichopoda TaxID=13333 RepID=UPI0009BDF67E|nr:uncharacterized protein LOC18434988 isoform X1 [Amborella trichopoda]|eukprot:XP_011623736.2 uncharacterized protein LOC18434988 isoform X1 [Amborella trichopoda]
MSSTPTAFILASLPLSISSFSRLKTTQQREWCQTASAQANTTHLRDLISCTSYTYVYCTFSFLSPLESMEFHPVLTSQIEFQAWFNRDGECRGSGRCVNHRPPPIPCFREPRAVSQPTITISSTASSPGYSFKDQIDPSTYSFSTALKALQVRSVSGRREHCLVALQAKWDEAEKYICNPLSGQFPPQCLSSSASGRLLIPNHVIAKSAPLFFVDSPLRLRSTIRTLLEEEAPSTPSQEEEGAKKGRVSRMMRDVGTQSTPPGSNSPQTSFSSSSPSPSPSPSPSASRSRSRSQSRSRSRSPSPSPVGVTLSSRGMISSQSGKGIMGLLFAKTKPKEEIKSKEKRKRSKERGWVMTGKCKAGACFW